MQFDAFFLEAKKIQYDVGCLFLDILFSLFSFRSIK